MKDYTKEAEQLKKIIERAYKTDRFVQGDAQLRRMQREAENLLSEFTQSIMEKGTTKEGEKPIELLAEPSSFVGAMQYMDEDGISMSIDETEYLRIERDGKFYVEGNLVGVDADVYKHFKEWLSRAITPQPISKEESGEEKAYSGTRRSKHEVAVKSKEESGEVEEFPYFKESLISLSMSNSNSKAIRNKLAEFKRIKSLLSNLKDKGE